MDKRKYYNFAGKLPFLCIIVEHGLRKEIIEYFDTTYPTVQRALKFKTNTKLAQKIRYYALNCGGTLVKKTRRG